MRVKSEELRMKSFGMHCCAMLLFVETRFQSRDYQRLKSLPHVGMGEMGVGWRIYAHHELKPQRKSVIHIIRIAHRKEVY